MDDPVIPYASVAHRGLTARDVFGVVVRSIGLVILVWAFYCLMYLLNINLMSAPAGQQPTGSYLLMSGVYVVVGLAMLKGEWLVRIAYGPPAAHP